MGLLLPLLARERHDRVHDNICGALARLLMASPTRKPEPQVRDMGSGKKLRSVQGKRPEPSVCPGAGCSAACTATEGGLGGVGHHRTPLQLPVPEQP